MAFFPEVEPSTCDLFTCGDSLQALLLETRPPHLVPIPPYIPLPSTPPCPTPSASGAGPIVAALIFDQINNYALSASFFSSFYHSGDLLALQYDEPLRKISKLAYNDADIKIISQVCRAARNTARLFMGRTVTIRQPEDWTRLLQRAQGIPYLRTSVKILDIKCFIKRVLYPDIDSRLCKLLPSVRIVRFDNCVFDRGLLCSLPSVHQLLLYDTDIDSAYDRLSSPLLSFSVSQLLVHESSTYNLDLMSVWATKMGILQSLKRVRLDLKRNFKPQLEKLIEIVQKMERIREVKMFFVIESFLPPMEAILEQHTRRFCIFKFAFPLLMSFTSEYYELRHTHSYRA
jgi:hypothetical protein